jgi:hypothetical protein
MLLEREEKLTLYFTSSVLKILKTLPFFKKKNYSATHWNPERDKIRRFSVNLVLHINLGQLPYFQRAIVIILSG